MTVPYTFATATGNIPLAELDANFAALGAYSNTAGTVLTHAQPNITTVGTVEYLSSTGNITADYFVGNGSQLTGIVATSSYGNSNVASYLSSGTDSIDIITSANVTANYFHGNGTFLTGVSNYANANVKSYLASNANVLITTTSNITTTANISATGNIFATGNISGTYILGNNSSITSNIAAGNISTVGNISGAYFIGNGSQLTGLAATYGNSNVAAYLPTYTGNLVSLTGPVTTSNVITANRFVGAGNNLSNIQAANITGTISSASSLSTGNFTITEVSGKLVFAYQGTNIASLTSAGVFTTSNNVTGFGTP